SQVVKAHDVCTSEVVQLYFHPSESIDGLGVPVSGARPAFRPACTIFPATRHATNRALLCDAEHGAGAFAERNPGTTGRVTQPGFAGSFSCWRTSGNHGHGDSRRYGPRWTARRAIDRSRFHCREDRGKPV